MNLISESKTGKPEIIDSNSKRVICKNRIGVSPGFERRRKVVSDRDPENRRCHAKRNAKHGNTGQIANKS